MDKECTERLYCFKTYACQKIDARNLKQAEQNWLKESR